MRCVKWDLLLSVTDFSHKTFSLEDPCFCILTKGEKLSLTHFLHNF